MTWLPHYCTYSMTWLPHSVPYGMTWLPHYCTLWHDLATSLLYLIAWLGYLTTVPYGMTWLPHYCTLWHELTWTAVPYLAWLDYLTTSLLYCDLATLWHDLATSLPHMTWLLYLMAWLGYLTTVPYGMTWLPGMNWHWLGYLYLMTWHDLATSHTVPITTYGMIIAWLPHYCIPYTMTWLSHYCTLQQDFFKVTWMHYKYQSKEISSYVKVSNSD